jgi:hypothetical protein
MVIVTIVFSSDFTEIPTLIKPRTAPSGPGPPRTVSPKRLSARDANTRGACWMANAWRFPKMGVSIYIYNKPTILGNLHISHYFPKWFITYIYIYCIIYIYICNGNPIKLDDLGVPLFQETTIYIYNFITNKPAVIRMGLVESVLLINEY